MSTIAIARFRAAILIVAPAAMLAGFLYHPHIGDPVDADFLSKLAAAVAADPMRWAISHLTVAVGSGLIALAFLALHGHLREAGEERWSGIGLPFTIMGSILYALLPAMEFAPLAAARAGGDIEATQAALLPWFVPVLFASAVVFLIGALGFAVGLARSGVPGRRLTWVVVTALVVMAAARLVPLSMIQFEVQGIAGIVALWPLAYAVWPQPQPRPQPQARRERELQASPPN